MSKQYIATFFTHYEAMQFQRNCATQGIRSKLMPVPRKLSSSCGTCTKVDLSEEQLNWVREELSQAEGFYEILDGEGYRCLYNAH